MGPPLPESRDVIAKLLAPAAHNGERRVGSPLDAALLSTGRFGRVRYRSPSKSTLAVSFLIQSNSTSCRCNGRAEWSPEDCRACCCSSPREASRRGLRLGSIQTWAGT
jgi:hypothetical protein